MTDATKDRVHCSALIAIEIAADAPERLVLDAGGATALGERLATDIARFVDGDAALDLVVAGALFDQAQLLRHGWPAHAALGGVRARLAAHADGGTLVAVGAHDGRMPQAALQPDTRLLGSPLLVLPWLLVGPADAIAATGSRLERELFEHGLVGASLALAIGEAFGVRVEHARHMTVFDLCALACAQYEHAGFAPLWRVVESVLLDVDGEHRAPFGGGELVVRDGEVSAIGLAPTAIAQARAVLGAHAIEIAHVE